MVEHSGSRARTDASGSRLAEWLVFNDSSPNTRRLHWCQAGGEIKESAEYSPEEDAEVFQRRKPSVNGYPRTGFEFDIHPPKAERDWGKPAIYGQTPGKKSSGTLRYSRPPAKRPGGGRQFQSSNRRFIIPDRLPPPQDTASPTAYPRSRPG